MTRIAHPAVALLLLPALVAGCATFGIEAPEVGLADIQFEDLTVFESSGALTVRVSNPNPEPLVFEGAVYTLHLDGVKVGTAMSGEVLEVPRLSSVTHEVPLVISNVALASRLRRIFEQRRVDWRIRSRLHLRRSWGVSKLRGSYEGVLDLSKVKGVEEGEPLTGDELGEG